MISVRISCNAFCKDLCKDFCRDFFCLSFSFFLGTMCIIHPVTKGGLLATTRQRSPTRSSGTSCPTPRWRRQPRLWWKTKATPPKAHMGEAFRARSCLPWVRMCVGRPRLCAGGQWEPHFLTEIITWAVDLMQWGSGGT